MSKVHRWQVNYFVRLLLSTTGPSEYEGPVVTKYYSQAVINWDRGVCVSFAPWTLDGEHSA